MVFKRLFQALHRRIVHMVVIRLFSLWERMGFHITQNVFWHPIPDTRTLKNELWLQESELVGIDINEQSQIQLVE